MIGISVRETENEIDRLQDEYIITENRSLRNKISKKMKNLQAMRQEFIVPNDEFNRLNRGY